MRMTPEHEQWLNAYLSQDWVWDTMDDFTQEDIRPFLGSLLLMNPDLYVLHPGRGTVVILRPLFGRTVHDGHVLVHPDRRIEGVPVVQRSMRWMFENTECLKIQAFVPMHRREIGLFASWLGFRKEGCMRKVFRKNGRWYDKRVYGIRKEDFLKKGNNDGTW